MWIDYELIYEPDKDEADPLDLSRHPLSETGYDHTEKIVRWTVNATVIERIREETQKDNTMQIKASKKNRKGRLGEV